MKTGYGGSFIDEVVNVGAMDTETLGALFAERGHEIAAFIGEPVIGAGGVYPAGGRLLARGQRLCREHDILLIADEVITGFGRTGHLWGIAALRDRARPDHVRQGRHVGLRPAGRRARRRARPGAVLGRRPCPARCSATATPTPGTPAAAAAAMANLDILRARDWSPASASLEPFLDQEVRRLKRASGVGEIRTVGLTAAVAFRSDPLAADPGLPERVVSAALGHGVATRMLRGHALQISPPFVIDEDEITALVDGLGAALDAVVAH